jgi:tyrosyl-tRNA synthetase
MEKTRKKLLNIIEALFLSGFVKSRGEARRLVAQGAVKCVGSGADILEVRKILSPDECLPLNEGIIILVGKNKYFKMNINA